jgi:hypothetical protein
VTGFLKPTELTGSQFQKLLLKFNNQRDKLGKVGDQKIQQTGRENCENSHSERLTELGEDFRNVILQVLNEGTHSHRDAYKIIEAKEGK